MANVPDLEGVPTVAPQTDAPDDYQRIQPKVGAALEQAGQTAAKQFGDLSDYFDGVAANDAFNNYQSGVSKLLHGDPSKKTLGPDGQPIEDTGYFGTKGRTALDARPAVEKQIDEMQANIRATLKVPSQIRAFDDAATKYKTTSTAQVSTHATDQQSTYFTSVNSASEQLALTHIANNVDDPTALLNGTSELMAARLKQAQLSGAVPGDEVWKATKEGVYRDAIKTQVETIGATDPSRAIRILAKNRNLVGADYENVYNDLRARADQQDGISAGASAFDAATTQATDAHANSITNPAQPVYRQAATDIPGGMSPAGLARTVQIESGGKADVVNASGHVGLGQFSPGTWKDFGAGGDPKNPQDSIYAIQRYAAANAKTLTSMLGRPPTDAELYLAHQQGPGGIQALLRNPDAPAASIVGAKAVIQNGGTQGMTSAQFVAMWTHKFNGTTPASGPLPVAGTPQGVNTAAPPVTTTPGVDIPAQDGGITPARTATDTGPEAPDASPLSSDGTPPASAKASAYQAIIDNPDLTPEAKQHAFAYINQQAAAMAVAADTSAAAKKQVSDGAANEYMTTILQGDIDGLGPKIANDPRLEWQTKAALTTAMQAHAENSVSGAEAAYGPGFWKAYEQVTAQAGDPKRIADIQPLLARAGPGGDLTLAGVTKLQQTMAINQKSVDGQAVVTTKAGLMAYAKSKLSFQQDTGPIQIKDPEGEALFNSRFIPKFEAAYDKWEKDGKDPWEFLTQDNVDKLMGGLRSPREMALARMTAVETGMDPDQLVATPAPPGVDEQGWKLAVNNRPMLSNNTPWPADNWTQVITTLQQHPTPDVMKQFDTKFAASGFSAKDLLDVLGVVPREANDSEKAPPAPATPPVDDKGNLHLPNAVINGVEDPGLPMPMAVAPATGG